MKKNQKWSGKRMLAVITAMLMLCIAVPAPVSAEEHKAVNTVEIAGRDDTAGTVTLRLINPALSNAGAVILAPTWSEQNGQDDIIWRRAEKRDDGSVSYTHLRSELRKAAGSRKQALSRRYPNGATHMES